MEVNVGNEIKERVSEVGKVRFGRLPRRGKRGKSEQDILLVSGMEAVSVYYLLLMFFFQSLFLNSCKTMVVPDIKQKRYLT